MCMHRTITATTTTNNNNNDDDDDSIMAMYLDSPSSPPCLRVLPRPKPGRCVRE